MSRPVREARELNGGFQTSTRCTGTSQRENACLTLLMAGILALATLIAVATVSMEVVAAAALC